MIRRLACGVVLVIGLAASASPASAAGSETTSSAGGKVINVSAAVAGSTGANPPASISVPCDRADEGAVWETVVYDGAGGIGGNAGTQPVVVNGNTKYISRCRVPGEPFFTQQTIYFAGPPQAGQLVEAVFKELPKYLDDPVAVWPNMSQEFGWLFVKVPMDYRIPNIGTVTTTATATNTLGSATASVTATPSQVSFVSGDSGGSDSCTMEAAREAYVPRSPGDCAYTYENSSATAANGYSFEASVTVTWDISSVPANASLPATLTTSTPLAVPVSEVQAVVTCIGSGC